MQQLLSQRVGVGTEGGLLLRLTVVRFARKREREDGWASARNVRSGSARSTPSTTRKGRRRRRIAACLRPSAATREARKEGKEKEGEGGKSFPSHSSLLPPFLLSTEKQYCQSLKPKFLI